MRQMLPVIFALALAAGCSGSTTIECPSGSVKTNGVCCPPGFVGHQGGQCLPPGALPDVQITGGAAGAPTSSFDLGPIPDLMGPYGSLPGTDHGNTPPPQDKGGDQGKPFVTTGEIGAPCQQDGDCLSSGTELGHCISWTHGYCSLFGCAAQPEICPEGSVCAGIEASGACLQTCEDEDGCRKEDRQHCKLLVDSVGAPAQVCFPTQPDAGGLGAACRTPDDCEGSMSCYHGLPGGLCTRDDCTPTSCPEDGACVPVDGRARCLKRCGGDNDCAVQGHTRTCEARQDLRAEEVNVCFATAGTAEIGTPCTSGNICESGRCRIVARGVCSSDHSISCMLQEDCPEASACVIAAEHSRGICTAPCKFGDTAECPTGCVADVSGEGYCAGSCEGPDDEACDPSAGLSCSFGIPLGTGSERYLCVDVAHPSALTACRTNADCGAGGRCLREGVGEHYGYCLLPCGSDGLCPFPGTCVQGNGGLDNRCYRSCNQKKECPEEMRCTLPEQGSRRVCIP